MTLVVAATRNSNLGTLAFSLRAKTLLAGSRLSASMPSALVQTPSIEVTHSAPLAHTRTSVTRFGVINGCGAIGDRLNEERRQDGESDEEVSTSKCTMHLRGAWSTSALRALTVQSEGHE